MNETLTHIYNIGDEVSGNYAQLAEFKGFIVSYKFYFNKPWYYVQLTERIFIHKELPIGWIIAVSEMEIKEVKKLRKENIYERNLDPYL
jgi:hypothetical protein